jgi:hypothetical protein
MSYEKEPIPPAFRLKTGLRFGILFSLVNSLIGIALYYSGLADFSGGSSGWISFLLTGLGIYLATEHYKNRSGGFMGMGDVMVTSLWMGFFSGLLGVLFLLIQIQLDPGLLSQLQNVFEFQLEKQKLEGEALDRMMEMSQWLFSPAFLAVSALIGSLLSYLFVGFILSFFLKNEAQDPF